MSGDYQQTQQQIVQLPSLSQFANNSDNNSLKMLSPFVPQTLRDSSIQTTSHSILSMHATADRGKMNVSTPKVELNAIQKFAEKTHKPKQTRRKAIVYIDDENKRTVCYRKRKTGLLKKANDVSILTGCQVLCVVATEGEFNLYASEGFKSIMLNPHVLSLFEKQCGVTKELIDSIPQEASIQENEDLSLQFYKKFSNSNSPTSAVPTGGNQDQESDSDDDSKDDGSQRNSPSAKDIPQASPSSSLSHKRNFNWDQQQLLKEHETLIHKKRRTLEALPSPTTDDVQQRASYATSIPPPQVVKASPKTPTAFEYATYAQPSSQPAYAYPYQTTPYPISHTHPHYSQVPHTNYPNSYLPPPPPHEQHPNYYYQQQFSISQQHYAPVRVLPDQSIQQQPHQQQQAVGKESAPTIKKPVGFSIQDIITRQ